MLSGMWSFYKDKSTGWAVRDGTFINMYINVKTIATSSLRCIGLRKASCNTSYLWDNELEHLWSAVFCTRFTRSPFQVDIWRLQLIAKWPKKSWSTFPMQTNSFNVKDCPRVQAQSHLAACPILLAWINPRQGYFLGAVTTYFPSKLLLVTSVASRDRCQQFAVRWTETLSPCIRSGVL